MLVTQATPPTAKTNIRAIFCLRGRFIRYSAGMGKRMRAKSVVIWIAQFVSQSDFLSMQVPGTGGVQNFSIGLHKMMVRIIVSVLKRTIKPPMA